MIHDPILRGWIFGGWIFIIVSLAIFVFLLRTIFNVSLLESTLDDSKKI